MRRNTWKWVLALALVPLGAWGQQGGAPGAASAYGSGVEGEPSLADAGFARNLLFFGADVSSRYDDNVRQTSGGRVADAGLVVSPELALRREGGRFTLALRYRPTLLFYRRETAYDEQDHDLAFDAGLRATARLHFRLRTDVLDRSGLLESFPEPGAVPALGPPAHLNDTIVTPFVNQFEDNSRADLSYALGPRSTFGVFTTYLLRSFGRARETAAPLAGTEGGSAGVRTVFRTGPRTTLGLVYVHEQLRIGPRTRLGLDAPSAGLTLALSPHASVNVYGGPVYTRLRDTLLLPFGPLLTLAVPHDRNDWRWAAGGGLTVRAERLAFRASASHQVSDGGGLLDAVTSDAAQASFERRVSLRWTIDGAAGWQRNASLPSALVQGVLEGEYARVEIRHPLSELASAGFGYEYRRQRGSGPAPLGADFDRNIVYVTLTYRFKNIPLGR